MKVLKKRKTNRALTKRLSCKVTLSSASGIALGLAPLQDALLWGLWRAPSSNRSRLLQKSNRRRRSDKMSLVSLDLQSLYWVTIANFRRSIKQGQAITAQETSSTQMMLSWRLQSQIWLLQGKSCLTGWCQSKSSTTLRVHEAPNGRD